MEGINVNVPEALHDFVLARVAEGGYRSAGEYVGELIRADQQQQVLAALGEEILKGASSGPAAPMTRDDWDAIRDEVRERLESRKIGS